MLHTFPTPLPDESLYSLAVRYNRAAANDSYRLTSSELFGTYSRTCGSILPCCLGVLSQRLDGLISVGELIQHHTLLPLYLPFLGEQGSLRASLCMERASGNGLKMSLGITASGFSNCSPFRYCPDCAVEDIELFGVAYWHRSHSAIGTFFCPRHNQILLHSVFPPLKDWRLMVLPGELPSEPIVSGIDSPVFRAIAVFQNWAIVNPSSVKKVFSGGVFQSRLSELGLLRHGRLKQQAISDYLSCKFAECGQQHEFGLVTSNPVWAINLLRFRGRVIQPFRFYFLCWCFSLSKDDLVCYPSIYCHASTASATIPSGKLRASNNAEARRQEFINDSNSKNSNKKNYNWLYRYDRAWLAGYISNHKYSRLSSSRVDWSSRDVSLSANLRCAHERLLQMPGKPIQITKSALLSGLQHGSQFIHNPSLFPGSKDLISSLIESTPDYQARKIKWVALSGALPCDAPIWMVLRFAGIRIKKISDNEIRQILHKYAL